MKQQRNIKGVIVRREGLREKGKPQGKTLFSSLERLFEVMTKREGGRKPWK